MFSFGPQSPTSTPGAAPAALPTQAAAPVQMDPAQAAHYALQGMGQAAIEERLPFLPTDGQFDCTIQEVRIGGTAAESKTGFCFYIDVLVNQSSLPACPPGGKYSHRISGFNSIRGKKFAFSDLKQFMCVALGKFGLTPEWNGAGLQIPAGQDPWIVAAVQMCQQNMAAGVRVFVQTSSVSGESGNKKTKASFHAAA